MGGTLLQRHEIELNMQTGATEQTTRQYDTDCICIAFHRMKNRWGYKRIMEWLVLFDEVQAEYKKVLDPSDKMCDVARRDMNAEILEITKDESLVIPFEKRYPWIAPIKYDKPYKEKRRKRR